MINKKILIAILIIFMVVSLQLNCFAANTVNTVNNVEDMAPDTATTISTTPPFPLKMAVEFNIHAASAYVSLAKDWFKENNIEVISYESYITGMALAAAVARGDIQAAYICLIPALVMSANAKVPIQIVAGTHKYGYGLVVNPEKITTIEDLAKPGIKVGCVREGGTVDILLNMVITKYNLDRDLIMANINRMSPPLQILALQAGKLDAAFIPEQWASMAEEYGFDMFLESKDIWPGMQGSVLAVRTDFLEEHPDVVQKLINTTSKATDWINNNLAQSAALVAEHLTADSGAVFTNEIKDNKDVHDIEFLTETVYKAMQRLEYTTEISLSDIEENIEILAKLGYLENPIEAQEILNTRLLSNEK
ncbi:MAG TPA: ABC transporter substrate-binding protein [Atribacterota bacterium]|nr:ABC transporter substrate-binding protein [Atribacterota bacterium]